MTAAPDIFISYSSDDRARAKLFADAFAAAGLSVWWDAGLRAGDAYDQKIEQALRAAKAVIVLWSPSSVASRWVRAEATLADRCKSLVPVTIAPCDKPIMFELTQTADLSHWQGDADDRVWQALLSDVQRSIGLERSAPANLPALATVASKSEPTRETLIAVLPFDNLSSDSEMDFFCDGVSEDIMGRIIRASKLQVVGRASSFQFRGPQKSKAAAALGASHVLDGSIRRAGNRVRITAQLTVAQTDRTIWADRFDRDLSDIFAVQDEISEAIAGALDIAFFPAATSKIDPVAYDLYLRGKQYEVSMEENLRSLKLMQAAVQIAPDFAEAWAMLSAQHLYILMHTPWQQRSAVRAQVESCVQKALAIDPDNPDAVWVQLWLLEPFSDFLAHERTMRRLEQIGQNSPDGLANLGYAYVCVGRVRDGSRMAQRAKALDPLNKFASSNAAIFLYMSGAYAAGLAALKAEVELQPDNHHCSAVLLLAHAHGFDWPAFDTMIDPARLARYPMREYDRTILWAQAFRAPDLRLQYVQAMIQQADQSGYIDALKVAECAELGFVEESFAMTDRCRFGPNGSPDDKLGLVAYRPGDLFYASFGQLRADPRFVKLCARLGLVEYWLATQKWPDCADTVPYDFRAECEKYRDHPKDVFLA
ncbi:MAG: TIR domain-containing protein [Alphaproteobacteria bacterium]|nr:TIR domain-containing protein [Alphaproteobacteria bacterium]